MKAQNIQPLRGDWSDDNTVHLNITEVDPASESPCAGSLSALASFSATAFLAEDTPAPGFVVEGLFPRGDVTVFAARSGIGKSFLKLQAALCVATGQPFLGQTVQPGVAVALFWEDPIHVLRERLVGLLDALGLTAEDVEGRLVLDCLDPNDPDRHVLWRDGRPTHAFHDLDNFLASVEDPALLVIDTAKIVYHDSMVDTETVRYFIGALRMLAARRNVAIALVSHVNNRGETSGTLEWQNHARAVVHIKPNGDHFCLEVIKTNYAAPTPPLPIVRTVNGAWALRTEAETIRTGTDRPKPKTPAERARQAFLEGLDTIIEPLSPNKNSPKGNYAPRRIARLLRTKQLKVNHYALEAAMAELLTDGTITKVPGPGKHKAMILERAKGEV
jgi:hypothetical protein